MGRVLVGYDIHDARRRRRVMKILRAETAFYQKSYFGCELTRPQSTQLFNALIAEMNPKEDGLIFAWLHPEHVSAFGQRWTRTGNSLYLVV